MCNVRRHSFIGRSESATFYGGIMTRKTREICEEVGDTSVLSLFVAISYLQGNTRSTMVLREHHEQGHMLFKNLYTIFVAKLM